MANNVLFYKQTDALEAYMYYLYGHCFEARLVIVHVGDSINRSNFHDMRSSVINRCRCNKLLTVLFLFGHFGSLCIYTSVYLDISVPYVFIPLCIWTFRFLMYLYLCVFGHFGSLCIYTSVKRVSRDPCTVHVYVWFISLPSCMYHLP